MANDTKVALLGHVSVNEIVSALEYVSRFIGDLSVLNVNVGVDEPTTHPKTMTVNGVSCPILYRNGEDFKEYGFIDVAVNGTTRNIFYHYNSCFILEPEEIEANLDCDLPEFNQPITTLSLGMDPVAVSVLTGLARYFGDYIDEDDCDDQYYHKVL